MPLRRAEPRVRTHPSAVGRGQPARQRDGIALHHQVEVHAGQPEHQIAHEPTDDVDGIALRFCLEGSQPQDGQALRRQRCLQPRSKARGFRTAGIRSQRAQQVGPRDDADDLAGLRIGHGYLAPVVLDHHPLQMLHRVRQGDDDVADLHDARNRTGAQAVRHRAIDGATRQQANHTPALHDRIALMAEALHALSGLGHSG